MTSEKQIDEQIQKDYEDFYNKPYDGELPENFTEKFKTAVMKVAPQAHQIHSKRIRAAITVPQNTLSFWSVGMMINILFGIPPCHLYENVFDFLNDQELLEKVRNEYNKKVADFDLLLKKKKNTLMRLSGIGNGTTTLAKA